MKLTIRELKDNYDWGKVCEVLGLNPWCINEGLATGDEEEVIIENQAREIGILSSDNCLREGGKAMSKFTPGPWEVIPHIHIHPVIIPRRMPSYSFGNNGTNGGIIATYNEANAQAIAALPELVEALEHMIQEWIQIVGDENENSTPANTLEKAKQALAKVEGREGER